MAETVEILRIEVDNESAQKALVTYEQRLVSLKAEQKKFREALVESNGTNKKAAEGMVQVTKQITTNTTKRKELTKSINTENNSLQAMRNNLAKAVRIRNQMNISTATGKKRFDELNRSILKQNNAIKKAEEAGGDFRRSVGNYSTALQGAGGIMGGFIGRIQQVGTALKAALINPLGIALLAVGALIAIFSRAVKGAKEFQSANAELAGVLGKTRAEITEMKNDAILLGSTTMFTATQVTRLQISLAKLGFTEKQIISLSKSVINLSIATKKNADEVATFTGGVIRQFKLLASEADRIADVSAKAFSSSALDFQKLSDAMAIVGTTGRIAGESFESTTAKLGILADNLIPAQVAATGLKNIYIDLADKGLTWDEAMGQINSSTDKLSTANELFGKRGAVVSLTLAENTKEVVNLNKELDNAAGSVQKLVDEQLNTLQGSLTLLTSAWDGMFLSIDDGDGVLTRVTKTFVDFGTAAITSLTGLNKAMGDEKTGFFSKLGTLIGLATGSANALATVSLAATDSAIAATENAAAIEDENAALEDQDRIMKEAAANRLQEAKDKEEREKTDKEARIEKRTEEIQARQDALEFDQQIEDDAEAAALVSEAEFNAEWDKLQKKRVAEEQKDAQREIDIENWKNQIITDSAFAASGAVISLLKKDSIAFKIAATAQAIIAGFLAIQKTLAASIPYPGNVIASISVGIQSAATVAKIISTGLAGGGRINNKGAAVKPDKRGDNRLILARHDEVILNTHQQSRIGAQGLKNAGVPGFADGGAVDMAGSVPSEIMQADMIADVLRNMEPPIVAVRDINTGQKKVQVKEAVSQL